jgi:hypothetical protein
MILYTRRVHPRNYYEAPIEYARFNEKNYHDATMYNISKGGMYFVSDDELRTGLPVYIKMVNFSPDVYAPGDYIAYIAQVRWCRKVDGASGYGIGVKHMAKGYIFNGRGRRQSPGVCELCGARTRLAEIHRTEDELDLCFECFKHLGGGANGKIRECVMKFMVGNVI